ncbi:outer membrane protein OmpX [Candidatus Pantoea carbekii]|uniref:Outer membrane protein X n=1 Tax=Candidatus Pantoea carbekii TaxID=1235990 RepID=U3U9S9_9GAMM|nr:outer membrane protein OmpX [Candidatus Pantoea carbekii]AKC32176.1 outer membrane protein X precursor OmpX [Candidatus Pantoea carbekii]BAO00703.1 hypothetical protein HHS_07330 [Candidatus Pantoea carbekii]
MKKIACLSALACLLAVSTGSAVAKNTVYLGFAKGEMQGVMEQVIGFNLKYHYEQQYNPISWLASFTEIEGNYIKFNGMYHKGQYYGVTVGPLYHLNNWAGVYSIIGLGYGKAHANDTKCYDLNQKKSATGFSYAAGIQLNPHKHITLDIGYEKSRVGTIDIGSWIFGIGCHF